MFHKRRVPNGAVEIIPFTDDIGYVPCVVTSISFPFHECDLPNYTIYRVCYNKSNTTGARCGAVSAYPCGAPEIIPSFWGVSCCLVFSCPCCVVCTIIFLFVLFFFGHGFVSLFLIYEFECYSGIFRPSFSYKYYLL